jgi:hypothetical protein
MRYGLVGIREDYPHRRPAMAVEYGCYGMKSLKEKIARGVSLHTIHDPLCIEPCMWAYGVEQLGLSLAYLYSTLAHEWSYAQRRTDTLTLHSILDIYTEIVQNFRRQKWLEPLIAKAVLDYDLLVYLKSSETNEADTKYNYAVRKLMKMFKGNYVQADSVDNVIQLINEHLKSTNQIYREQAQSNPDDSTAFAGENQ